MKEHKKLVGHTRTLSCGFSPYNLDSEWLGLRISNYKKVLINDRQFFIGSDHQKKIDRELHRTIKKRYQKTDKNRNYIIDSLINQLSFKQHLPRKYCYTVIRLDIKKFFENVNTHGLYKRIVRSNILSEVEMDKIKQVVFSPRIKGLPQGVSFSSLLAEVYLEDFDFNVKIEFDELLYYSRYVDDILLIFNGDYSIQKWNIIERVENLLMPLQLKLNRGEKLKCTVISSENNFEFDYLGYEFSNNENSKKLTISVNDNKIIKYKKHIEDLFNKFYNSQHEESDFYKLYYSLRNLLWITTTTDFVRETTLTYGFTYNYKNINCFFAKDELNKKLKYHIHCKKVFTRTQKKKIYSLLFKENVISRYNYNKISTKKLLVMLNQLNIEPVQDGEGKLKDLWVGQLFKKLYE